MGSLFEQYLSIKDQYPDCIVFLKSGSFYNTFNVDADIAHFALSWKYTDASMDPFDHVNCAGADSDDIHAVAVDEFNVASMLTARQKRDCDGREVGYGAGSSSIDKFLEPVSVLLNKGFKVAVADQVKDKNGRVINREVTKIYTPGSRTNLSADRQYDTNFIMCIYRNGAHKDPWKDTYGIAVCDVTLGTCFKMKKDGMDEVCNEFVRLAPMEIIHNQSFDVELLPEQDSSFLSCTSLDNSYFSANGMERVLLDQFCVHDLSALGIVGMDDDVLALGSLIRYLSSLNNGSLSLIKRLDSSFSQPYMGLDRNAIRSLELLQTIRTGAANGSLFHFIDRTKTAAGRRLLKHRLLKPSMDLDEIHMRQDQIAWSLSHDVSDYRIQLSKTTDIGHIPMSIQSKNVTPGTIQGLSYTLKIYQKIQEQIGKDCIPGVHFHDVSEILHIISRYLQDGARDLSEVGTVINPLIDDSYRVLHQKFKTGDDEIRVRCQKICCDLRLTQFELKRDEKYGYVILVKGNKAKLPDTFMLVGGKKMYKTQEIIEMESELLMIAEELKDQEQIRYVQLLDALMPYYELIRDVSADIAVLDVTFALAFISSKYHYCRPELDMSDDICIKDGRHPVVESMHSFVSNDIQMNRKESCVHIISGSNMGGKSTFMRQVALIVILAQMGCYVPAERARIGLVDHIFTRIGTSDDISTGQSTFMVEMSEMVYIINYATDRSLVILDELGRGTSPEDGSGLAKAILKYMATAYPKIVEEENDFYTFTRKVSGIRTLFATHFQSLFDMDQTYENIKNFKVSVEEQNGELIFLHKIVPGYSKDSEGIHVAEMAGIPKTIIEDAKNFKAEMGKLQKDTGKKTSENPFSIWY